MRKYGLIFGVVDHFSCLLCLSGRTNIFLLFLLHVFSSHNSAVSSSLVFVVVVHGTARTFTLYIYSLYKLVRPRTVLYLAVDGVAPRAKMNQQRSRRFRAAKEMEAAALERAARGENHPINKNVVPFDSNCITPGTDFMLKLSLALQKWVQYKLDTDPIWQTGADVIVSGPDVPGEGEHKVMDFIRAERTKASSPYYRPNMVHVLYGTFPSCDL